MLTIRLSRKGKKNQPFFRVVLVDKRKSSTGGRSIEDLGYVNPLTKKISLNKERIQYWIKTGAQPSATIHNLLIKEKIIDAKKVHVSKISKKKQAEIDKASADAKAVADKKVEEATAKKEEAKPAEAPVVVEEPKPEESK
jgi:small subunit ribosomal protein S16